MILKTVVYLLTSLIAVECAFSVLLINKKSPVNIIYFLLALDFAVCSIVLCHISSAPDIGLCYIWYYVNLPFGCVLTTLMLHFILVLIDNKIIYNRWIISSLYIAPVAFTIAMLKFDYFSPVFIRTEWGWDSALQFKSIWNYLFIIFFYIPPVLGLVIFINWKNSLKFGLQRKFANSIVIPYLAGTAGVFICPYFWYIEGSDNINMALDMAAQLLFFGYVFALRLSIRRYKLIKISRETPADDLITGLNEPVFLVMKGGEIISYNQRGADLIDISKLKEQTSIYDIFDCPETLKSIIEKMFNRQICRSDVRCSISVGRDGKRSFNLNIQSIINQSGELNGVIVFLKEDSTVVDFKKLYGITDRQLDIIFMVVTGLSNRHISEKLGIAEKTVENHLFNIYNKLGIENKIELFNLTQKYNIIPN